MRENRPYGSEGGEGFSPSRPLSDRISRTGFEIDDQFDFRRLLDRQVGRLLALGY